MRERKAEVVYHNKSPLYTKRLVRSNFGSKGMQANNVLNKGREPILRNYIGSEW